MQERQSLLGNAYVRFQDENDELALGQAQDEASLLSRLLFNWVSPLIKKGMAGYLGTIDDLFMLPECLNISNLSDRLRNAIDSSHSLLRALHRAHGFEFYSIGLLRFVADMAGFAGPLLLGGLLTLDTASTTDGSSDEEFDGRPYLYALGLFGSTLLCEFNFNFVFFTI